MDITKSVNDVKTKMAAGVEHFGQELTKLRTGRAHPSILDSLMVEAYGQKMVLKSVASISVPEPQLLVVKPFDPANLQPISQAIHDDKELGLNPTDDGHVVRVAMPPMTTETRQAMVKTLHQRAEEAMIGLRQVRHDAFRGGEQAEKDKQISKDERFKFEKQVDDILNQHKIKIDQLTKNKEQEIMTV
ncbi:ribosome recycling factor [Candidatus Saccharibacteria bacterium RIFCSPHIGHO2_12_FULL_48_21]|nr:MAG: ribosome recycling factor [Candidatus Saccharibacteria bacterium RIFCSPHIGHO2_12_FULL_48_21]